MRRVAFFGVRDDIVLPDCLLRQFSRAGHLVEEYIAFCPITISSFCVDRIVKLPEHCLDFATISAFFRLTLA